MSNKIVNLAAFQLNWFACVLGAAKGLPWLGPLSATALGLLFVRAAQSRWRALALIGAAIAMGLLVDTLLTVGGLLNFRAAVGGPFPPLAPPWILSLWIALATTLDSSMAWLKGRYLLAALLGAISGPLAYLAGERLGAVELGRPLGLTILGLAAAWAACLPLLFRIEVALGPSEPRPA